MNSEVYTSSEMTMTQRIMDELREEFKAKMKQESKGENENELV